MASLVMTHPYRNSPPRRAEGLDEPGDERRAAERDEQGDAHDVHREVEGPDPGVTDLGGELGLDGLALLRVTSSATGLPDSLVRMSRARPPSSSSPFSPSSAWACRRR
jgi:hypothetical protein